MRKDAAEALAHFTSPAPSMSERKAAGKALREKLPRERHAEFTPGRRRPDPVAILAGYVGKSEALDEAVTRFAFAYAEQTERDHDALARAARAKRIEVAETA